MTDHIMVIPIAGLWSGKEGRMRRWAAYSTDASMRYFIHPRMVRLLKTAGQEIYCFYGRSPFEAIERMKTAIRKAAT